jgi:Protein of unknown function (DUF3768)
MRNDKTQDRIRELNDIFRQSFNGGRVMLTREVNDLEAASKAKLLAEVRKFNRFCPSNDPYGEHDFGAIDHDGVKFFWKIEYFDLAMNQGSVDPTNTNATIRVLTIMRADEY